jgi:hypothetical protein
MTSSFFLFLEALFLHSLLTFQLANGFFVQHPSRLPMSSTRFWGNVINSDDTNESLLKSSASSVDGFVLDGRTPKTNSSLDEHERDIYDEIESAGVNQYPWSDFQQWALRDNLQKYTIRIPIKQKTPRTSMKSTDTDVSAKKQEDTVLTTFALWRSLQNDVPELSGYPIDFLQARYEEMHIKDRKRIKEGDDDNGTKTRDEPPTIPGILPFIQEYEFSAGGGICGYVYGMDGVTDGSQIETSAVRNIKESLPKGYIQTSDGSASFELGNPLQPDERNTDKRIISSASAVKNLGLEKVSDAISTNKMRSLLDSVEDGDAMLLRLGALSGFFLAGATAINMLSHHLTVNVFWV